MVSVVQPLLPEKKARRTEKLWEDATCASSTVLEILEEKTDLHHNYHRKVRPKNVQAEE